MVPLLLRCLHPFWELYGSSWDTCIIWWDRTEFRACQRFVRSVYSMLFVRPDKGSTTGSCSPRFQLFQWWCTSIKPMDITSCSRSSNMTPCISAFAGALCVCLVSNGFPSLWNVARWGSASVSKAVVWVIAVVLIGVHAVVLCKRRRRLWSGLPAIKVTSQRQPWHTIINALLRSCGFSSGSFHINISDSIFQPSHTLFWFLISKSKNIYFDL